MKPSFRDCARTTDRAGRLRRAEASLLCAIEVADSRAPRCGRLRAATSLGRLWHAQGNDLAARAILAPIYEWFTEGFDTKDLRTAAAMLAEIS